MKTLLQKLFSSLISLARRLGAPFASKRNRQAYAHNEKPSLHEIFASDADLALSYFQKTLLYWHMALLSAPLDILWLSLPEDVLSPWLPAAFLTQLVIPIICLSILCSFRLALLSLIQRTEQLKEKLHQTLKNHTYIIPILVGLGVMIELIGRMRSMGLIPLLFFIFFALISLPSWIRSFQAQLKIKQFGTDQNSHLLPLKNLQYFIINIFPILGARISGLLLIVLSHAHGVSELGSCAYLIAELMVLFSLQPEREDYLQKCMLCGHEASVVGISNGRCTGCLMKLKQSNSSQARNDQKDITGRPDPEKQVTEQLKVLRNVLQALTRGQAQLHIKARKKTDMPDDK